MGEELSFLDLSLEDLMNIEVTSVTKRAQSIATAASAVFVITSEDIARSGVSTIPDALRMAPGVQVLQLDTNKWGVSARGFNNRLANKLLVLVDGRTVYSPSFSGVYWENVDLLLADIDRIEVIRGSGATLWGSNAVNGVINITTKSALDTHGSVLSSRADSNGEQVVSFRTGDKLSESSSYRLFGKYRQAGKLQPGLSTLDHDRMDTTRFGFRIDGSLDMRSDYTLQGETYESDIRQDYFQSFPSDPNFFQYIASPVEQNGHNLLSRWTYNPQNSGVLTTQFFYDYFDRREALQDETRKIFDLDFQYEFPAIANHRVIIGGGYRKEQHKTKTTPYLSFTPRNLNSSLTSFFLQDEILFLNEALSVVIGSKFEHTEFSSNEIDTQPSAHFSYAISENHSIWGGASKALRVFSRGERDGNLLVATILPYTATNPSPYTLVGVTKENGVLDPETLISYELGYRSRLANNITVDISVFKNEYDDLRSSFLGETLTPKNGYIEFPVHLANESEATSTGVEIATELTLSEQWKLKATYSYLHMNSHFVEEATPKAPRNQFNLRSKYNLSDTQFIDLWVRYVSSVAQSNLDSYTELDIKYQWSANKDLKIGLIGRNLLNSSHSEFLQDFITTAPMLVKRSVAVEFSYQFQAK